MSTTDDGVAEVAFDPTRPFKTRGGREAIIDATKTLAWGRVEYHGRVADEPFIWDRNGSADGGRKIMADDLVNDPAPVELAGDPVRDGEARDAISIVRALRDRWEADWCGLQKNRRWQAMWSKHSAIKAADVIMEALRSAAPQPDPDLETAITTLLTQVGSSHEAYPGAKRDLVRAFLARRGAEARGEDDEEDAARHLYSWVGALGLHGPNPKPWTDRSDEHKGLWRHAVQIARRGARAPVAGGEPVEVEARQWKWRDGTDWHPEHEAPRFDQHRIEWRDLYAHPPAPLASTIAGACWQALDFSGEWCACTKAEAIRRAEDTGCSIRPDPFTRSAT